MKDYSLYYSYKNNGDVLIITFDGEKEATKSENRGRVTIIYNNSEIIGYQINNIKEIIKIKSEGMIYLPNKEMVEVINSILKNAKLEPLEEKENSGYFTAEVDGKKVVVRNKNHICTYKDLGISEEEEILYLDKDIEIGKDFFTMEVK